MTADLAPRPPWSAAPADAEDPLSRLAWYADVARWAPSKHNSQPWRFVLSDGALQVWNDPMRTLTRSDPHRREMVLACGAALQLATTAARSLGVEAQVTVLPGRDGGLLAELREAGPVPSTAHDQALLAAAAARRTDRGPLDARALPPALPFELQSLADEHAAVLRLVTRPGDRATLARLVEHADRLLATSGGVDEELADWVREPDDRREDGVNASHSRGAAASRSAEFVQRDFARDGSMPAHARSGPDHPLVGVLCTSADSVPHWLAAGRALAAVLLHAGVHGASASYLNQPVEEPRIRAELRDQLELPGPPQLVLRIGIGGAVPATRRRALHDVFFDADASLRD